MKRAHARFKRFHLPFMPPFSIIGATELEMTDTFPTLYEYYTSGGITVGLSSNKPNFTLNNKPITIYSGALHYFRVPPQYWRDRLRKLRAAGLNAVETYVPWNLHEPEPGNFDFGSGISEFSNFLNLEEFLKIAQEEDLLAIVRPGPYICSEWEFGGLPSWILRVDDIKVRTSDLKFVNLVEKYFKQLLSRLVSLQFTKGGPIIALQIENEYGNTKNGDEPVDTAYLETLKKMFEDNEIVELLFTSDTPSNGFSGTLPGVLATANFQDKPIFELAILKEFQPNKPLMVMEYWTGWFDHWGEKHHTRKEADFAQVLEEILGFNSSVNFYMFHGGTNWGFLNGANIKDKSTDNSAFQPDITSYDYDAPLTEAGGYTDKYHKTKEIIAKFNQIKTRIPDPPPLIKRKAYNESKVEEQIKLLDLIKEITSKQDSQNLLPMEKLNINNNSGQHYGYIVYRQKNINIPENSVLKIEGHVCDTVLVLINGQLESKVLETASDLDNFGYWRLKDSSLNLSKEYKNATLDLVVENFGRNNYGKLNQFNQFKGLWQGGVLLNNKELQNWEIFPLEFKKNWSNSLRKWEKATFNVGPVVYKATLNVDEVFDTYVDMRGWNKGIVIVNGFVLARYCKLGPQKSVYLPAPFLKKGENVILIFEHFQPSTSVKFVTDLIFEAQNN